MPKTISEYTYQWQYDRGNNPSHLKLKWKGSEAVEEFKVW